MLFRSQPVSIFCSSRTVSIHFSFQFFLSFLRLQPNTANESFSVKMYLAVTQYKEKYININVLCNVELLCSFVYNFICNHFLWGSTKTLDPLIEVSTWIKNIFTSNLVIINCWSWYDNFLHSSQIIYFLLSW